VSRSPRVITVQLYPAVMTRYRQLLEKVIAEHTGQPLEKVSIFAARRDNTLLPIDTDTARELDGLPCYPRNSDATGAWRGSSAIVLA
jgi:hypothetical protein